MWWNLERVEIRQETFIKLPFNVRVSLKGDVDRARFSHRAQFASTHSARASLRSDFIAAGACQ